MYTAIGRIAGPLNPPVKFPNMERRYKETDSIMVREELAKYLSNKFWKCDSYHNNGQKNRNWQ